MLPASLFALLLILLANLTTLCSVTPAVAAGLPAFPGAEGHGAMTPGGRGGAVILVTNLNASGPGSLRAAVEAKGPRIIVFRVGGTIRQTSVLEIHEPYLTIAGQTAPGGGITIRGPGFAVMTHDVIIRGMRFRVGADDGVDFGNADGLRVDNGSNVIVDHCSFSWALDENLSTSTWSGPTHNVTFQWNIISEGLYHSKHPEGDHSMGLLIYQGSRLISVHHNLLAHNNQRNPMVKGDADIEFVNNVVYDWGQIATEFTDPEKSGPTQAHLIGNVYKTGPGTVSTNPVRMRSSVSGNIYLKDNSGVADSGAPGAQSSQLHIDRADQAYESVLSYAGAFAPQRDSIDARVVSEVRQGKGKIINSPSEVGGWLNVSRGSAPTDSDKDGMPDRWESDHGLSPKDANDRNNVMPDGYTALETYINSLISPSATAQRDLPYAAFLPELAS